MRHRMEAVADPAERATMQVAEIKHIVAAGIDPAKIVWLEWEPTGREETVWTIDTDADTAAALEGAGWLIDAEGEAQAAA
jgi:hypothetical protein